MNLQALALSGSISSSIGNLTFLQRLHLSENLLYVHIPKEFGMLSNLLHLNLSFNLFEGLIPHTLSLEYNLLQGTIPEEIGILHKLKFLNLADNQIIGPVPNSLGNLSSLQIFSISENQFGGSIPTILSKNNFVGHVPQFFESLINLTELYLVFNNLPSSLELLRGLQKLDLSHNKLIGEIPTYLTNFSLEYLNLSFNLLEGEVPTIGIFSNASAFSVFGNKQLCGGIPELHLPTCFNQLTRKARSKLAVVILVVKYGMANQVSTRGDVYSFGILLLEIVTGRRPIDENFIESHGIQKYVQTTLPEQVMSIIDPKMFSLQGDEEVGNEIQHINNIRKHELECIIAMLNIGLLCSKELPLKRIQIGEASNELHAIKDIFSKAEQAQHN
ncbi:hypothetical protein M5K25_025921 [Dendrobium thyrsiflorum]|uniref:Uncharacterized protein n=1 Tax=Dendrobium thyrsiflorum TaxID=117978 RepID=A0ABD0TW78_DENTH